MEGKKMYVYIKSEPGLWTVGFYKPDGNPFFSRWEPESDYNSSEEAAERVAWLNGSRPTLPESVNEALNSGDGTYRP
jgi:hypothetical protein